MRAGAQVHELAVLEEANGLTLGDVAHALHFEGLTLALEVGQRLGPRLDRLLEDLVLLGDFAHLLFDLREIVGGEAVLQFKVVVEPLFGGRPYVQQRIGPEPQDRGRQDVRARVTQAHQLGHLLPLVQRLALNLGLGGFKLGLLFVVHSGIGVGSRWTQMKAEGGRLWQLSGTFRVDMGLADSSGSRACLSQLERRLGYEESERGGVAVQEILAGYRPQLAMSENPVMAGWPSCS